jgi:5-formyltetrahydrofolate cyclo-ligase
MNLHQPHAASKVQLRRQMRHWRQALSEQQQQASAAKLLQQLTDWRPFQRAHLIAGYLAQDGELSLDPVFQHGWQHGKQFYLPVLRPLPPNRLWFAPYNSTSSMQLNRYRIPEPRFRLTQLIPPSRLDLVLFPLVAFDPLGGRLGMGGGFYDRTFAHLKNARRRPLLVGVAHDQQRVDQVPREPWDIPLDAILTPSQKYLL